jgi:DNA-binding transcriptional regulator YiaG
MTDYMTFKANRNTKTASLLQVDWARFGEDIRKERTKRNLSMREFEALTGVSFGTISRIENQSPCSTEVFLTLVLLMSKNPMLYTKPRSEGVERWEPVKTAV